MIAVKMKRLVLILAAAASLAATMAGPATAADDDDRRPRHERQDRRERHDQQEQRRQDQRRGGPERWDDGRRERVPALGYGDERRGPRGYDEPRRYDEDRRYGPPPRYQGAPPRGFAAPPPARRGGYLPHNYRGDVIQDYRRYRLRPPPQGYAWVRVGGGFALVSLQDGRVFDMVQ